MSYKGMSRAGLEPATISFGSWNSVPLSYRDTTNGAMDPAISATHLSPAGGYVFRWSDSPDGNAAIVDDLPGNGPSARPTVVGESVPGGPDQSPDRRISARCQRGRRLALSSPASCRNSAVHIMSLCTGRCCA